jgi:hypothetical protein
MNADSPLHVKEAGIIFTKEVYGIVSDHGGIYAVLIDGLTLPPGIELLATNRGPALEHLPRQ